MVALFAASCTQGSSAPAAASAKPPPPTVTAAPAVAEDVPEQVKAIGTVQALATVSVKTQVHGILAQATFHEGDEIQSGSTIFQIDPAPFQAALDQAQAVLERDQALLAKAEADFQRAQELKGDGSISQSTFDQRWSDVASRKATVSADQAGVRSAKLDLDHCTIRSPITGRIGQLMVDVGNVVKENDSILAMIRQVRPIYVVFSVPAQHLGRIRARAAAGQLAVEAKVTDPGVPAATGTLELIESSVDASTGTIQLRARFSNDDERLWPGQYADVALTLGNHPGAVVVPAQAVQEAQQGQFVFVVKADSTVEQRPVHVGDRWQDRFIVNDGVAPGENVVTSGALRLVSGMQVNVQAPEAPTGAPPAAPAKDKS